MESGSTSRILLIRLTALGDVVYALPALTALRRHCPKAHVAWAVEEAAAGLLRGHPFIDDLIVVPRKVWQKNLKTRGVLGVIREARQFRRDLRARRFDVAIDLQGNLRGALVARASGAPHTIGFAPPCSREHAHLLVKRAIAVDPALHKLERNLALLEAIGVHTSDARGVIPPPAAAGMHAIAAFLSQAGISEKFVLVHPGVSTFGSLKQWPAERYAELCRLLKRKGVAVVLSAGPGEEELAEGIAAQADGVAVARGFGLLELGELMRRAGAFAGSDTGPTQMAWMAGTPTVALMGPKDPAIYGPLGSPHRKLYAGHLDCRPCTRRTCPDNRCMKEIATQDVLAAAISIMKR